VLRIHIVTFMQQHLEKTLRNTKVILNRGLTKL